MMYILNTPVRLFGFLIGLFLWSAIAQGEVEVERPYMLWTQEDLEAMREKVAEGGWYAELAEATLEDPHNLEKDLLELWRWAVKGDEQAGNRQKDRLLEVARSPIPRGAAQWLTVLRYDLLYDELSEEERAKVEDFFRTYIDHAIFRNSLFDGEVFNDERDFSRYHAHYHRRDNWLPNITFPRILSANLMAVALGEEALIRQVWDHYGSWRWYFDEYLSDQGLYNEDFGKQHATPGEMLLYAIALENFGLGELGFGYRGRHGATLRNHIESMIWLGYPQVDLQNDTPHFPRLTHGDARRFRTGDMGGLLAFQDFLISGFLPDGTGTIDRWKRRGAWGGEIRGDHPQWDGYHGYTPKMQTALWFEVGHTKWPEAGFGYFLSWMREPGEEMYRPSLYFGVEPLSPGDIPPPPAPSWVAERRGVVMLRAEESPEYWESSAPAVGMRLATPYAHDVFDGFALTGLYAYNRPILVNRHIGGYARDWSRSVLSHAGVKVDGHEPAFTDLTATRYSFPKEVKFFAAYSPELYPGIDASRALFLTDAYLLDIFALADRQGEERTFRWTTHSLGMAEPDDRWAEPQPLTDALGATERDRETATEHRLLPGPQEILKSFDRMRIRRTGEDWHMRVVQESPVAEENRLLPPEWFARKVGVEVRVLGAPDTAIGVGPTPVAHDPQDAPDPGESPESHELAGTSVLMQREAPEATFAVLYEPFEGGAGEIVTFRRITETEDFLATAIGGEGEKVNDLAMVRFRDDGEISRVEDGETGVIVDFRDHAVVRIGTDRVEVFGDVRRMRMPAPAGEETRYYHNGRLSPATVEDGQLRYDAPRG
ncbi:MAG: hypothetical protein LAT55_02200 [Opitutales bacterium]|nr:hypothetical protein [Opitutales bacterium]